MAPVRAQRNHIIEVILMRQRKKVVNWQSPVTRHENKSVLKNPNLKYTLKNDFSPKPRRIAVTVRTVPRVEMANPLTIDASVRAASPARLFGMAPETLKIYSINHPIIRLKQGIKIFRYTRDVVAILLGSFE
jgi:hypothetical protein